MVEFFKKNYIQHAIKVIENKIFNALVFIIWYSFLYGP